MHALISLLGMVVLLGLGLALSKNRRSIRPRTILGAFAIQFLVGGIVLFVHWGSISSRLFPAASSR